MYWTPAIAILYFAADAVAQSSSSTAKPTKKPFASSTLSDDSHNFPGVKVKIGDSDDEVPAMLDSGSTAFWVKSSEFSSKPSSLDMKDNTFSLIYGGGWNKVSGNVASDKINLGGDLDFDHDFGWADSVSQDSMTGTLGFGLGTSDGDSFSGGWKWLQDKLSPPVIGLRMQRKLGAAGGNDLVEGQVDWGGPDPKYLDQGIDYEPVTTQSGGDYSFWNVKYNGIHVDGQDQGVDTSQDILLDTGTSTLSLKSDDAQKVNKALGGGKEVPGDGTGTQYTVPCNLDSHTLKVGIAGNYYEVPGYAITNGNVPGEDMSTCLSTISGSGDDGQLILGQVFLQSVYTVWDYENKQVGFASVKPLDGSSSSSSGDDSDDDDDDDSNDPSGGGSSSSSTTSTSSDSTQQTAAAPGGGSAKFASNPNAGPVTFETVVVTQTAMLEASAAVAEESEPEETCKDKHRRPWRRRWI
ncbi:MAG: hypothetical protein Q9162_002288 [Coniocarpon cinnabarinum]